MKDWTSSTACAIKTDQTTLFLLHVISQSFVYIVMQSSWERTDMHLNSNDGCNLNDVVFFKTLGLLNICRRLFLKMRQYKADIYIPCCERKLYNIKQLVPILLIYHIMYIS